MRIRMVTAYRSPPRQLSVAPPAPWWRLLRAWLTGTFRKLPGAKRCREYEVARRKMKPFKGRLYTGMSAEEFGRRVAEMNRLLSLGAPSRARYK